jgi:uncharacterized protein (TIGR03435 family)
VQQGLSRVDRPVDSTLTFEVASVRPNELGSQSQLSESRSGRFTARYVTLEGLIRSAYGKEELPLTEHEVEGGPTWLYEDRFDVLATMPGTPDSPRGTFPATVLTMLRNLLEERFHLKAHFETREEPLFALVLAREDGTLGPDLRRRTLPCTAVAVRDRLELFAPPSSNPRRMCGGRTGPGMLMGTGLTMTNLVSALSQARLVPGVGRVVVDRTGLTGTFDVDLQWTMATPLTGDTQGAAPAPSIDANVPSLFTALQEQLGLKLVSTKGLVEVLVIDHVEQPTPN